MSSYRTKEKLDELKRKISDSHDFFEENYTRYNEYRWSTYKDSRTYASQVQEQNTGQPNLEVNIFKSHLTNIVERYIAQNPSLRAFATAEAFAPAAKIMEAHLRAIMDDCNEYLKASFEESASGGFSVLKVATEYASPTSFDQKLLIQQVSDPTLCYFDKRARKSHKGDGEFSGEIVPMTIDDFRKHFGEAETRDMVTFYDRKDRNGNMSGKANFSKFQWRYKASNVDYIMVCDHFEKKYKKKRLLEITAMDMKQVMLEEDYERLMESLPPDVPIEFLPQITNERMTTVYEIYRYSVTEGKILKIEKTAYPELPHIFVSGDSKRLNDNGLVQEMTIPYVYPLKDIQKVKNYSFSQIGNDLQNMNQSLAMMPVESVPDNDVYREALTSPQRAQLIVYNHLDRETGQPLPPPQLFPRAQTPAYVQQIFYDNATSQSLLGNYFHQLANPRDQLSGKAIQAGDMASSGGASPYFDNFIQSSLGRIAFILVRMMPIYYRTGQNIPVKNADGTRSYYEIKEDGEFTLRYSGDEFEVEIKPGLSSTMQKKEAFATTLDLMNICPVIKEFICTTPQGINYLLSNIESRGIDSLREMVDQFVGQYNQKQQQQQMLTQQQIQENQKRLQAEDPMLLKSQELQIKARKDEQENAYKNKKLQVDWMKEREKNKNTAQENNIKFAQAVTQRMKVEGDLGIKAAEIQKDEQRMETENERSETNLFEQMMRNQ